MPLLDDATDAETTDDGEWFVFPQKDGDKDVRFKIRAISDGEGRAIYRRHFGRKRENKTDKHGMQITSFDSDLSVAHLIERASYALLDCQNLLVRVRDKGAAEAYAALLGRHVEAGEIVALDGKLNDGIKRRIFDRHTTLANWILKKSDSIGLQAREEDAEEGKD